jgi:hypothetical protein
MPVTRPETEAGIRAVDIHLGQRKSILISSSCSRARAELTNVECRQGLCWINPENYDRYLVPLIFQDYAREIARRVASLRPKAVLEVAAGSGAVTREFAPQLSPEATYVVTDLN